jgi:hypothetical protein
MKKTEVTTVGMASYSYRKPTHRNGTELVKKGMQQIEMNCA